MAFKTYAGLATTTTVLDADLSATYSGSGPLKAITAANLAVYFGAKLAGTSGATFGLLNAAVTRSGLETVSLGTATTALDYLALKPTDFGTGKPGFFISKEATALNWQCQLYDGASVAGQLDLKLTLLNITGALTVSGLGTFGTLTVTGALTLTGGATQTGSTKQAVTAVAALNVDLTTNDFFTKAISTNSTFTFSGATASTAQAFILELTISAAAVPTWPASVTWANGAIPTLGNGRHVLGFVTFNGGTTWAAIVGGTAFA